MTPTVEELAAHWEGFAWETGAVMVQLGGDRFGVFQVWAESEEEGRRVIRHALTQSGFEEKAGDWITARSRNPRYGVSAQVEADHGSARVGPS